MQLEVINPFSGAQASVHELDTTDQVDQTIQRATNAKASIATLPSYKRSALLMQIADRIRANKDHLARAITMDNGKPIKYSLAEIDRSAEVFEIAAEEARRVDREYIDLEWGRGGEGREGLVKRFPVGVIAGITPFNFPLNLIAHKVAPAIAAGCPIIVKPSPKTPNAAIELMKLIDETDLPKDVVQLSLIPNELVELLVKDDRIAMISFTGSPEVGWSLKGDAGMKKVTLELGGNAGVIVMNDADIDRAVKRCVVGGFVYSGQVCIHGQRIMVHQDVFEQFRDGFVESTKTLKSGDPMDKETDISHMISREAADRVKSWIDEATAAGAELLLGGGQDGGYIEPTILTRTTPEMKVNCLEIFGPVVTLEAFSDYDEAIERVNDSPYGLQAGVFTNDLSRINKAFEHLEVGGVIINDVPTYRMDHMPYGGVKASGFGREGLKYSIQEMTEPRILVKPSTGY